MRLKAENALGQPAERQEAALGQIGRPDRLCESLLWVSRPIRWHSPAASSMREQLHPFGLDEA
jgi:hypothetical protein